MQLPPENWFAPTPISDSLIQLRYSGSGRSFIMALTRLRGFCYDLINSYGNAPRRLRYDSMSASSFDMRIWQSKLQIAALVVVALVLLAELLLWRSKVRADRAQAARDASHAQILSMFQRDLHLGMHRSEVYDYLRGHSLRFGEANGRDALVAIGRDPAPTNSICEFFYVSVLFEFNELLHQRGPLPLDNLKAISLYRDCQK